MKKLLLLLAFVLLMPVSPVLAESNCPVNQHCGMVHFSEAAREAKLRPYKERLAELGGTYIAGTNRFRVMRQIFEIEKTLA